LIERHPLDRGIARHGNRWRVAKRVFGTLRVRSFPLDEPIAHMRAWRDAQAQTTADTGTLVADMHTYLSRIAAVTTVGQIRYFLCELWAPALGRDRARHTITSTEIDRVMQEWLTAGAANGTVIKRFGALRRFFTVMNGKGSPNPARGATPPKPPKAQARGRSYATIERLLEAMPDRRSAKHGTDRGANLAKIRVALMAYTGLPHATLGHVRPHDVDYRARTVTVPERRKGEGIEARTLPLTPQALQWFRRLDEAHGFGPFTAPPINVAVKRAARRIGLDPATIKAYDFRHSFGTQLYRQTKDLATVGRLMLHAPGSPITAIYTLGAHEAVDRAAVAAFGRSVTVRRPRQKAPHNKAC
jgi:integrase